MDNVFPRALCVDDVYTCVYTFHMTTTIQKWGNSLGVRIPKEIAKETCLREGSVISFSVDGDAITLTHAKKPTYSLEELLKSFDKKTQHEIVDWGDPVGSEVW